MTVDDSNRDSQTQLVLDTNVLVHLARWDDVGKQIDGEFNLLSRKERAIISFVTTAEILVLARRRGWGDEKYEFIDKLNREMVVAPTERNAIVDAYVDVDVHSRNNGETMGKTTSGSQRRPKRSMPPF